jgi:CRISPR-associated endonuclease/helicase Cas3
MDEAEKYYKYWGKCGAQPNEGGLPSYHLLVWHCLDVAAVGKVWLRKNDGVRIRLSRKLKISKNELERWFCFFLCLHDVGKFSVTFQNLKPELRTELVEKPNRDYQYLVRHDQLAWDLWDGRKRVLYDSLYSFFDEFQFQFDEECCRDWFEVWFKTSSGHHGKPVNGGRQRTRFEKIDMEAVQEWFKCCWELFGVEELFQKISNRPYDGFSKTLKLCTWELSGITVICDWLGSDSSHFPFISKTMRISDYWESACFNAEKAFVAAGLENSTISNSLNMKVLFPHFNKATPLQEFCDTVDLPDMPQCWILEDVTGAGKTEAALTLAGRIASTGLAEGLFVALPTMATSNAMYERMADCYRKFFSDDSLPSLVLAHGAKHLSAAFRESCLNYANFANGAIEDFQDEESAVCSRWISDSTKKAMLAEVGVGSLDQVLLSALPVRHQSLRWCGLVRKVLIIDEVHAYDEYMLKILQNVLKNLAASGGSVILLSATLPKSTREKLLGAFYSGQGGKASDIICENTSFPLVSGLAIEEGRECFCREEKVDTRDTVEREVAVSFLHEDEKIYEIIQKTISAGKCICWIRNTVKDAFDSFEKLKNLNLTAEDRLHLFHSRFAMDDRLNIESDVLEKFGKKSDSDTRRGRVLIATQVVEQSLDLDFDVLISDLAPVDYLIQRAGRLHRHLRDEKGNRVEEKKAALLRDKPMFYVYAPEANDDPEESWFSDFLPGAACVYEDTANLWMTQQLLMKNKIIKMPEQAREYIEGVYGDDIAEIPESLIASRTCVEGKGSSDRSMAHFNQIAFSKGYCLSSSDRWGEEENVPTRLGTDQQTVYLTKMVGGVLKPFCEGEFAWDKSSLKIRQGGLESQSCSDDVKNAVEDLKKGNRKFYDGDLVLVLEGKGELWCVEGFDKKGREVKVLYDGVLGWREDKG